MFSSLSPSSTTREDPPPPARPPPSLVWNPLTHQPCIPLHHLLHKPVHDDWGNLFASPLLTGYRCQLHLQAHPVYDCIFGPKQRCATLEGIISSVTLEGPITYSTSQRKAFIYLPLPSPDSRAAHCRLSWSLSICSRDSHKNPLPGFRDTTLDPFHR